MIDHFPPALLALSRLAFIPEDEAVRALRQAAAPTALLSDAIFSLASSWVDTLRTEATPRGVESMLKEYGLATDEGVALMCLAEALLRIPDAATADALIHDKLTHADWRKHLGHGDGFWVNASSWALLLTGSVLTPREGWMGTLQQAALRLGEPVIREAVKAAMRYIGRQFVLGETMPEALARAARYTSMGYQLSYDVLGEGARTEAQADAYVQGYLDALSHVATQPGASLSVKLSALSPHTRLTHHAKVMATLKPRLMHILEAAKASGTMVSIDAEETSRLDLSLWLLHQVLREPSLAGWNGVGWVVQAYTTRATHVIAHLETEAIATGRVIPVRLVKGAYWDFEIKSAQLQGLPNYPVFTRKAHTDLSYLVCSLRLLQSAVLTPQFATHNARTLATVITLARHLNVPTSAFEVQRLHGMGEMLHQQALAHVSSRVYAPVGPHQDLLAYLIRRLLENGANSSFVHLLMTPEVPVAHLLEDPLTVPDEPPSLPLPEALHAPHRLNSSGVDVGNAWMLSHLYAPAPMPPATAFSPLERAADLLESRRGFWVQLLCEEARKTWVDALSEIREAADFCRYYAAEARRLLAPQTLGGPTGETNVLSLHPRGTFVCISPWNFPLAIFIGQVAAALATGNRVIAKPAPQTPRIAQAAVALLYESGIPETQLELAVGGADVGAALLQREELAGVVFTGSTATARQIARTLAERSGAIVPLIAETGGQNCMVIDSSALLEHALDDVMLSAFGSAGQRCSALRVAFVQEEIADRFMSLLAEAMQTLTLGDGASCATDIPPLIDAPAQARVLAHIARMEECARLVGKSPLPAQAGDAPFVAPHAFEIPDITLLHGEVFGPVLHLIRFRAGTLDAVADAINSTGYGLTFGIHSRINHHVDRLLARIRAGNFYINRSMIGATVGVQPFGGEGLSGTGFKAGGPHYLLRFLTERTTTVNTAAIGGNVALLGDAGATRSS